MQTYTFLIMHVPNAMHYYKGIYLKLYDQKVFIIFFISVHYAFASLDQTLNFN